MLWQKRALMVVVVLVVAPSCGRAFWMRRRQTQAVAMDH